MSRTTLGPHAIVLRGGPFSVRFRRRTVVVGAALAACVVALSVVALGLGDLPLSAPDVVATLLGQRSGIARTVVVEWRLPGCSPQRSSVPHSEPRAPCSSPSPATRSRAPTSSG